MGRKKRAERFGSEEQKVRNGAVAVLEPELEPMVEVSPRAEEIPPRPPKPEGGDVTPCPNWDKGAYERERPWLRCQGWAVNGHDLCRNCHAFSRQAPVFQSVSLETISKVVFNAQNALRGVVESFKRTKIFGRVWDNELEEVLRDLESEHEKMARDYSSPMRRVQKMVREIFAEEAKYLHDQCSSWADRLGDDVGQVHTDFHNWEAEVQKEEKRANINGEYPRWIFLGTLRYPFREKVEGRNLIAGLRERYQQGSQNNRRNGGNGSGWNPDNGWVPRR